MPGAELTRRRLAAISSMLGLSAVSGCAAPVTPTKVPVAGRAADVHCHFFNARDIPVEPFVREVVLREYPLASPLAEPVVILAQAILELGAISATREAQMLRGVPAGLSTLAAVPELPEISDDDALTQDRVRRAVTRMQSPTRMQLDDGVPRARMTPELRQFLQRLILQTGVRVAQPQGGELRLESRGAVSPDAAALAVTSIGGEISGIVRLASLLTLRRSSLADRLHRLPKTDCGDVVLFTPAMVDYGYWLNAERATTPLAQQVDVMSAVAARKGSPYAVHAYVSFCPWRQMMEPGQMDTVMDAILNKGCIGVKVYPVMGFLPYDNAIAPDKETYPQRLRDTGTDWAGRLDQALSRLYDFCVKEDVPILTHCSQSQQTSDAAGRRASPDAWAAALRNGRWPDLRVNLGHFGGFWSLTKPGLNGWTDQAVRLMVSQKNVYADVSDHDAVVEGNAAQIEDEANVIGNLNRILSAGDPGRIALGKLMYGTDWVMLSRSEGLGAYYPNMKARFTHGLHMSDGEARGFLGGNAARFLGLIPSSGAVAIPKTRARLEAFYKANSLDNSVLASWDRFNPGEVA